jgi:hypothetical protein
MKDQTKHPLTPQSPAKQLEGFIARFEPPIARLLRSARRILRRRFPTAVELVYDNYNALAIGWGPNERASEVVVSLAGYASGVSLYFVQGKRLKDPLKLLEGGGNQGRFIRLYTPAQLADPAVEALLASAIALGTSPLPVAARGYTVIKSISAKQRPRRKPSRATITPSTISGPPLH